MAKTIRYFEALIAVVIALAVIALSAVVAAPRASAVGSYSNGTIADVALRYVNQYGGQASVDAGRSGYTGGRPLGSGDNDDGECRAFLNAVVYIASGRTQWVAGGANYFSQLAAYGVRITDVNALVKGDVVQIGQGIHTFIIVSRVSGSTFYVVDSNHNYDHRVSYYKRTVALSDTQRAYRLGSTAPPPLPAEPRNPHVTGASSTALALAWTDASSNETAFVTQYRVDGGSWVRGPVAGVNAQSVTIGGLRPSTHYTIQVGAQNSAGKIHWSAYAYGTTKPGSSWSYTARVTNYDNDGTTGVFLRNSSDINNVNRDSAHFLSYGTSVQLLCAEWGSQVGPYRNSAWDYVRVQSGPNAGRMGHLPEHWINTPVGSNQHVSGEPGC